MADIELVVKIDETEYMNIKNAINSLIENGVERASMSKVCLSILDGAPLPKGHGRLGDLDELTQRITNYIEHNEHMMDELTLLQEKFILEGIKDTPTIIESDGEVKRWSDEDI